MTDDPTWTRRPYETDAAFNAFHEFYLTQSHPRSINEAYRRYKGYPEDNRKPAVLSFKRWSQGVNKDGSPIEGGLSWQERARAYDNHLATLRLAEYEKRHMGVEEALAILSDQARANHGDFADVNLRDDLKDHPLGHLVKTINTDTYEDSRGRVHHKMKIELHDAQRAVEDILKIHGKFANDPGSSEEKPFIMKVVYGERNTGSPKEPS